MKKEIIEVPKESGRFDCFPIALSHLKNIPFEHAQRICIDAGKKKDGAMTYLTVKCVVRRFYGEIIELMSKPISLAKVVETCGNNIIAIIHIPKYKMNHALVLKNGKAYDIKNNFVARVTNPRAKVIALVIL